MPSLQSLLLKPYLRWRKSRMDWSRPLLSLREECSRAMAGTSRLPFGVTVRSVNAGGVAAEWIEPLGMKPQRTILYLHGGLYCMSAPRTHRALTGRLALAAEARLLALDYRLAPEHAFPAALQDTLAAYRWLVKEVISPARIAIGGDSAGGGLSLAAAVSLREGRERLPAALFLISPWVDLTLSDAALASQGQADASLSVEALRLGRYYFANEYPTHPLISPLYAELKGLPPLLIQVGGNDILLNDARRLAHKAFASWVEVEMDVWKGMWHAWHLMAPRLPEANRAIEKIGAFLRRHVKEIK